MPAFIETQFPIARLSAESYKERKANNGQTLTRLGKWWGRKPLILVRAAIMGMLMPASNDPKKDREIYLKILTMDDAGALARWKPSERFNQNELMELATPSERQQWDALDSQLATALTKLRDLRVTASAQQAIAAAEIQANLCGKTLDDFIAALQVRVFNDLPYAQRIARCERPENIEAPGQRRGARSTTTWAPRPVVCPSWSNSLVSGNSVTPRASGIASAAAVPSPLKPPASAAMPSVRISTRSPGCSPGPV